LLFFGRLELDDHRLFGLFFNNGQHWLHKLLDVLEDIGSVEHSHIWLCFRLFITIQSAGHAFEMRDHLFTVLGSQVVQVQQSPTQFLGQSSPSSLLDLLLLLPYDRKIQDHYDLRHPFLEA
jgi:hypothetical protein